MWLALVVTIGVRLFCNSALTGSYLLWGPMSLDGFRQSVLFERLTLLFADAGLGSSREKSNSWNGVAFPRLGRNFLSPHLLEGDWVDINESVSGAMDCRDKKEHSQKTEFQPRSVPDIPTHLHDQQHFPEHETDPVFNDHVRRGHFNLGLRLNNTRLQFRFNFAMSASDDWSLSSVEIELGKLKPTITAPKDSPYRWTKQFDNRTLSDSRPHPRWVGMKAALAVAKTAHALVLPRFSV